MYGRENRLKVKRDEEKAAIEQAEKDEVHQKASFLLRAREASSPMEHRWLCSRCFNYGQLQQSHFLYGALLQAESEFRHLLLLKRAQAKPGAVDTSGELPGAEPDAEALQNAQILRAGKCKLCILASSL